MICASLVTNHDKRQSQIQTKRPLSFSDHDAAELTCTTEHGRRSTVRDEVEVLDTERFRQHRSARVEHRRPSVLALRRYNETTQRHCYYTTHCNQR